MNAKSLRILLGMTVVVVALAVVFQSTRASAVRPKNEQTKLFPELVSKINDVSTIRIERGDGQYTLQRTGDTWGLVEKNNYPADIEPVRKALIGLVDMLRVEPKTSDPERYAQLGVQDPAAEGSTATLVTLADGSGEEVAKLVVGKSHVAKSGMSTGQIYVRKAGEAQSWLVKADLDITDKQSTDWLAKKILEVKRDRVRAVEVTHPDGEIVRVEREKPEINDFTLVNVPEGKELKYPSVASAMSSTLEWLNLEDVAPADTIDFTASPGAVCRFWCFDGLVVTVSLKDEGEKTFAKFEASYEAPTTAPTEPSVDAAASDAPSEDSAEPSEGEASTAATAKKPEEVQSEVNELNARLSKWAYVVPSYNRTTFAKRMDDLVKDTAPTPPAEPPSDDGTLSDEEKKGAYVIPSDLPPEIQQQIKEHQESLGNKTIQGPPRNKDDQPTDDADDHAHDHSDATPPH